MADGIIPSLIAALSQLDVRRQRAQEDPNLILRNLAETLSKPEAGLDFLPASMIGAITPKEFTKLFPEFATSKAVNATGDLQEFYTGTSKDVIFDEFKKARNGTWFSKDPKVASEYAIENDSKAAKYNPNTRQFEEINTAARVMPVYLNTKNTHTITQQEFDKLNVPNYRKAQADFFDMLRVRGIDSVDFGNGIMVALDPSIIKSSVSPLNKQIKPKKDK